MQKAIAHVQAVLGGAAGGNGGLSSEIMLSILIGRRVYGDDVV